MKYKLGISEYFIKIIHKNDKIVSIIPLAFKEFETNLFPIILLIMLSIKDC